MTPNQGVTLKFNGRHHLFSTSDLLPCRLCVSTVQFEFGRWVAFALSGGWWHRKSQKIRITQQLPGESFLGSAVPCWLCQWPLTSSAGSCTPVPTLLGLPGQAKARKTEAQLLCHVLALASPVPFPNSWRFLKMGSDFTWGRTPSQ